MACAYCIHVLYVRHKEFQLSAMLELVIRKPELDSQMGQPPFGPHAAPVWTCIAMYEDGITSDKLSHKVLMQSNTRSCKWNQSEMYICIYHHVFRPPVSVEPGKCLQGSTTLRGFGNAP